VSSELDGSRSLAVRSPPPQRGGRDAQHPGCLIDVEELELVVFIVVVVVHGDPFRLWRAVACLCWVQVVAVVSNTTAGARFLPPPTQALPKAPSRTPVVDLLWQVVAVDDSFLSLLVRRRGKCNLSPP
jgi:hypothetical protein